MMLTTILTVTSIILNIITIYKVFSDSKELKAQKEIINNLQVQVHRVEKTNIQASNVFKSDKIIYNEQHKGRYCTRKAFDRLAYTVGIILSSTRGVVMGHFENKLKEAQLLREATQQK